MLDTIHKLQKLLSALERRNAVILFFMILINGIMEAVGVASIMPFLAVLSNPKIIQSNSYLLYIYQTLDFSGTDSFLLFIGTLVFVIVLTGISFKALTLYFLARFTHIRSCNLSSRLLRSYLYQPYSWFLNRHSADLGKTLLSEVQQVINQSLMPTCQFIANIVQATCLIVLLLIVAPWVALFMTALMGGIYTLIYLILRKYLSRIGRDRVTANQERFQIAQEALGGIKEIKVAGLEAGYLRSFYKPAYRFAKNQAASMIAGQLPNFALEALAFGGILVITLFLLATRDGDFAQVIPTLGLFAIASQRLLPALRQIYQNVAKMRFGKPALDDLYADLVERTLDPKIFQHLEQAQSVFPLGLKRRLDLVNVEFRYPNANQPTLHDLSISISANTTVGFIGTTGAGKTTAVDLILGLFSAQQGVLLADEVKITSHNLAAWQRSLGYVPQQIFLSDDTVAANIAFGVEKEDIDQKAIKRAACIAELHDFVLKDLPLGYETMIGEHGVRLSGGQRQRIGIARALYHDPDVLILDEATSALDNLTEKAVMQAVHNLSKKKTIIMIAHRLSTVKECDYIYMLDRGTLTGQGTFSELLKSNQEFQKMAAITE